MLRIHSSSPINHSSKASLGQTGWSYSQWGSIIFCSTGKSLSEALIFPSTNTQYDDRLFIELQVQYMKIPSSNLGRTCCVQKLFLTFRTIYVNNMF